MIEIVPVNGGGCCECGDGNEGRVNIFVGWGVPGSSGGGLPTVCRHCLAKLRDSLSAHLALNAAPHSGDSQLADMETATPELQAQVLPDLAGSLGHPNATAAEVGGSVQGEKVRSCNRHVDCDAADRRARESGRSWADHCHDDCCEECFGS